MDPFLTILFFPSHFFFSLSHSRKVPYWIGISAGVVMAWGCIPMVFDFTTADWFNTHYVTTDLPPPEDLETWLEVGSWTWGWAEPFEGRCFFCFLFFCFFVFLFFVLSPLLYLRYP